MNTAYDNLSFAERRKLKKKQAKMDTKFKSYQHLLAIKPHTGIVFYSDYFRIDRTYCSVISFSHKEGADDGYGAFWGCNFIPMSLGKDISCILVQNTEQMSKDWVSKHQVRAEGITVNNAEEQARGGNSMTTQKAVQAVDDMQTIAKELVDGGVYLMSDTRLIIKAQSLHKLEEAIKSLKREYTDSFGTIDAATFDGCQYDELQSLFTKQPVTKPWYFTSQEFAGMYDIVSCGIEDPTGVYVGYMSGDINNSAIIIDPDILNHHAVVMNDGIDKESRANKADRWAFKASEVALLHGHRVVHFMLSDVRLNDLTIPMKAITNIINMNRGDINMFEMFGDEKDELSIFDMELVKLRLMMGQFYHDTGMTKSIVEGNLHDQAITFYTEHGMWTADAEHHRDKLRIVNIPHEDIPKLDEFVAYLQSAYTKANNTGTDQTQTDAMHVLYTTFQNMLTSSGDLFNTITSDRIDDIGRALRTLYDFRQLMQRGKGIAMAQFINVLSVALRVLDNGDMVIFHGTEEIDPGIKDYIDSCLLPFYHKGGRVIFCYNSIDDALDDIKFNHLDQADYTVSGRMTNNLVKKYQDIIGEELSPGLATVLANSGGDMLYFRRGYTNVTFEDDMQLKPERTDK